MSSAPQNLLKRLQRKQLVLANRMLYADTMGSNALANGNTARDEGKKKQAEKYYDRGQYWLDRSNTLRDQLFEINAEILRIKETPMEPPKVKVVRTCPRCRTHAYHWGNDKGIKHRIACVNCGHEWAGRIKKEEME